MARAGQAIFRRPGAKAKRAARAAERKRYSESFSYEDDQKARLGKAAAEPPAAAASGAASKQADSKQTEDRRDKRR